MSSIINEVSTHLKKIIAELMERLVVAGETGDYSAANEAILALNQTHTENEVDRVFKSMFYELAYNQLTDLNSGKAPELVYLALTGLLRPESTDGPYVDMSNLKAPDGSVWSVQLSVTKVN